MDKNCRENKDWSRGFGIILFVIVITFVGCSKLETEFSENPKDQLSVTKREGSILVNKYMTFVSTGRIEEANKLLSTNPKTETRFASTLNKGDSEGPDIPWSSLLYERNLELSKIIDEKTGGQYLQVYALLRSSKISGVNIFATFYLQKTENTLKIKSIDLKPGKSK